MSIRKEMSGIYAHRPMGPAQTNQAGRLFELLESLKSEFENATQELSSIRGQKEEFEFKLNQQLQEMSSFHQTLFDLERNQAKIKQQYEEEIVRLRREIEMRPSHGLPLQHSAPIQQSNFAPAQINLPPVENGPSKRQRESEKSQDQSEAKESKLRKVPSSSKSAPSQPPPASAPANAQEGEQEILPGAIKKEGTDWHLLSGKQIANSTTLDLAHNFDHSSVVCCVKFSYDSKYIATGCNRVAQVYDVATGQKVAEFSDSTTKDGDLYIRSVCFSPDGQYLATGAEDRQIRLWDIKKNKIKHVFQGHEQDIYSLDFSRDGTFICSGSGDRTTRIWAIDSGKLMFTLGNDDSGPKDAGVTSVAISPDSRLVASGSLDKIVRIWDTKTGKLLEKLEGHKDSVYSVAFSPDGKYLVSGSLDKSLKVWDLGKTIWETGKSGSKSLKATLLGHKDFVLSVAFSPDGKWIVSGSKDRTVIFWDAHQSSVQMILHGHKNSVISVSLSPDCSHFATGSGDCRARLWKIESTQKLPPISTSSIYNPTANSVQALTSLSSATLASISAPQSSVANLPPLREIERQEAPKSPDSDSGDESGDNEKDRKMQIQSHLNPPQDKNSDSDNKMSDQKNQEETSQK